MSESRVPKLRSVALVCEPSVRVLPDFVNTRGDTSATHTMSTAIIGQNPQFTPALCFDLFRQCCEAEGTRAATMMTDEVCSVFGFLARSRRIQVDSKGSVVPWWVHFERLSKVARCREW